jgi:GTP-binding protein
LAVSKCDLIDEDQLKKLKRTLPKNIPAIFISALANQNIDALKDMIWKTLEEENLVKKEDKKHE